MQSDLLIPRISAIVDRALDLRESAVRLHDAPTIRQLDRLIEKLPGARLCWQLGTLHIASPSGGQYRVSRAGCDCLNAQKCGKRACWHVALFELLIDLFAADCDTLDMDSDAQMERRPLGCRLAEARGAVWAVNWTS
jgi:hypothetical protein